MCSHMACVLLGRGTQQREMNVAQLPSFGRRQEALLGNLLRVGRRGSCMACLQSTLIHASMRVSGTQVSRSVPANSREGKGGLGVKGRFSIH